VERRHRGGAGWHRVLQRTLPPRRRRARATSAYELEEGFALLGCLPQSCAESEGKIQL